MTTLAPIHARRLAAALLLAFAALLAAPPDTSALLLVLGLAGAGARFMYRRPRVPPAA